MSSGKNVEFFRQIPKRLVDALENLGLGALRSVASPLVETTEFGTNPGNLRMFSFVPEILQPSCALVVVLHGCGQDARSFDRGTGWSVLADHYGFALLVPEQQRSNNLNRCFNWFNPQDTQRESGEACSISQMIAWMTRNHKDTKQRNFVTGLSAGGAMTSAMLATYSETFAAGAIIAGLPYGVASNAR
jgi:poly(hydroxyalkanoate) depolymerase family esterase